MKWQTFRKSSEEIMIKKYYSFYFFVLFVRPLRFLVRQTRRVGYKVTFKKLYCNFPWEALAIDCDGSISCSCADPFKMRVIGNMNDDSIMEIWNNEKYQNIRRGLLRNDPSFCYGCGYLSKKHENGMERPIHIDNGPRMIWIEPAIICNLSCLNACCAKNTPIRETRGKAFMDLDMFKRIIDELRNSLERINLFNYGEPFIHPNIFEMIRYARNKAPYIEIFLSTNGMLLNTDEKRRRLIESGISTLMFSIDGASQETYGKYRRGGDFDIVYNNMKRIIEIRNKDNKKSPKITWSYILFNWNDSAEEISRALRLAEEAGVDKFIWRITTHPIGSPSKKFYIGSREFEKIKEMALSIGR